MTLLDNKSDRGFKAAIAEEYGILGALLINRILWAINENVAANSSQFYIDGKWWTRISMQELRDRFSFVCLRTIKSTIKELEREGILLSAQQNMKNGDVTKWYAIDGSVYTSLLNQPSMGIVQFLHHIDSAEVAPYQCNSCTIYGAEVALSSSISNITNSNYNLENAHDAREEHPPFGGADEVNLISVLLDERKDIKNPTEPHPPSTGIPKKSKPVKKAIKTWEPDDPFSQVFGNLTKLSICLISFDVEDYREWLKELMQEESLTIPELVKTSKAWQEYHNGKVQKPKVAKSSYRTWLNNHISKRTKQTPTDAPRKPRPGDIDYDYG